MSKKPKVAPAQPYTYCEAEHDVLFRFWEAESRIEIWNPKTRAWERYTDRKDFAETGVPISERRARQIMGEGKA